MKSLGPLPTPNAVSLSRKGTLFCFQKGEDFDLPIEMKRHQQSRALNLLKMDSSKLPALKAPNDGPSDLADSRNGKTHS
jgi:hypothetical protein